MSKVADWSPPGWIRTRSLDPLSALEKWLCNVPDSLGVQIMKWLSFSWLAETSAWLYKPSWQVPRAGARTRVTMPKAYTMFIGWGYLKEHWLGGGLFMTLHRIALTWPPSTTEISRFWKLNSMKPYFQCPRSWTTRISSVPYSPTPHGCFPSYITKGTMSLPWQWFFFVIPP